MCCLYSLNALLDTMVKRLESGLYGVYFSSAHATSDMMALAFIPVYQLYDYIHKPLLVINLHSREITARSQIGFNFCYSCDVCLVILGKYLYIEASAPRRTGDNALYVSTALKPTLTGCFKFYYHMLGNNIGELNVYMRRAGESNSLYPEVWLVSIHLGGDDVASRECTRPGRVWCS